MIRRRSSAEVRAYVDGYDAAVRYFRRELEHGTSTDDIIANMGLTVDLLHTNQESLEEP